MKKPFLLSILFLGQLAQAKVMECESKDFPPNMGSTLRVGESGSAQLYFNDGESDLLKKSWASYNISKPTINQYGQSVYYLSWGGGSSTNPADPKHVPRFMALHPFKENILKVGVFKQQLGNPIQNTETIYTYFCK